MIKNKKSQITLFLVVGIVLLFSSAMFFLIRNELSDNDLKSENINILEQKSGTDTIKDYISYNIKNTFEEALYLSALNGGRLYDYNMCYATQDYKLSYFRFYNSQSYPALTDISDEILFYIKNEVSYNLLNDELFEKQGIILNLSSPIEGDIIFGEDDTYANIKWEITITKENSNIVSKFEDFMIKSNLRYLKLYNIAKEVSGNEYFIPLEYDSLKDDAISLQVFPYDEKQIFYTLKDNSSSEPLIFMFATKDVSNSIPKLDFIHDFRLKIGETLKYTLTAEDIDGDQILFESNNSLINIDSEGYFEFTPLKAESFSVKIGVSDYTGLGNYEIVNFEIENQSYKEKILVYGLDTIYINKTKHLNYNFTIISKTGEEISCKSTNPKLVFNSNCVLRYLTMPDSSINQINSTLSFIDNSGFEIKKNISVIRI